MSREAADIHYLDVSLIQQAREMWSRWHYEMLAMKPVTEPTVKGKNIWTKLLQVSTDSSTARCS